MNSGTSLRVHANVMVLSTRVYSWEYIANADFARLLTSVAL